MAGVKIFIEDQVPEYANGDLMADEFSYPVRSRCPERKLLLAMIERAILDLKQPDPGTRQHARSWIFSSSMESFSILWILEVLDLGGNLPTLRRKAAKVAQEATARYASLDQLQRRNPREGLFELN